MGKPKVKECVRVINPDGANGPTVYDIACSHFTTDAALLAFATGEAARWTHLHLLALAGKDPGVELRDLPDVVQACGLSKHPYVKTWQVKGDAFLYHSGLDQVTLEAVVYSVNTSRGRMLWKSGDAAAYTLRLAAELKRLRPPRPTAVRARATRG